MLGLPFAWERKTQVSELFGSCFNVRLNALRVVGHPCLKTGGSCFGTSLLQSFGGIFLDMLDAIPLLAGDRRQIRRPTFPQCAYVSNVKADAYRDVSLDASTHIHDWIKLPPRVFELISELEIH